MNNRQRKMGYNPGLDFTNQISMRMEQEAGYRLPL